MKLTHYFLGFGGGSSEGCFPPGSIVNLIDGSVKKIQDIVLGDSVLTGTDDSKPEFSKFLGEK